MSINPENTRALIADWLYAEKWDDTADTFVCLTKRERMMLAHVAQYLGWVTRWDNAPNDRTIVQQKADTIIGKLFQDCRMDIRQNPFNHCQLQYSWNGGQTWKLGFDFSLCLGQTDVDVIGIELLYQQIITVTNVDFDGTLISIQPTLVYGDADDFHRDTALCWAIHGWIDLVSEAAIVAVNNASALGNALRTALLIVGLIVSVATFGAAAWILAGIAIASGLFKSAWVPPTSTDELSSSAVRSVLACRMYDNLRGSTVEFSDWLGANDGLPLVLPFAVLGDAVDAVLPNQDAYFMFLRLWASALELAKQGVLNCPCEADAHHYFSFDLTSSPNGAVRVPVQNPFHNGDPAGTLPELSFDYSLTGDVSLKGGQYRRPGYPKGLSACVEVTLPDGYDSVYIWWWTRHWSTDPIWTNSRQQIWIYDSADNLIYGSEDPNIDFAPFIKRHGKADVWTSVGFSINGLPDIKRIVLGSFSIEDTGEEAWVYIDAIDIYGKMAF